MPYGETNLGTPLELVDDVVVPTDLFFVRSNYRIPTVDPATWRLRVHGLVERPLDLGLADLRAMPQHTVVAFLECSGNSRTQFEPATPGTPWRDDAVGNATWTGVPLRTPARAGRPAARGDRGGQPGCGRPAHAPRSPDARGARPGHAAGAADERRGPPGRARRAGAAVRPGLGRDRLDEVGDRARAARPSGGTGSGTRSSTCCSTSHGNGDRTGRGDAGEVGDHPPAAGARSRPGRPTVERLRVVRPRAGRAGRGQRRRRADVRAGDDHRSSRATGLGALGVPRGRPSRARSIVRARATDSDRRDPARGGAPGTPRATR